MRGAALGGSSLLSLRDRGTARPYVLGHAGAQLVLDHRLMVTQTEGRRAIIGLSVIELAIIAWLGAVQLGFRRPGLAMSLAGWGELLREYARPSPRRPAGIALAERTCGRLLRRLAAMGLITVQAGFRARDGHECQGARCRVGRHTRVGSVYALAPHVLDLLAAERHAKRGGARPLVAGSTPVSLREWLIRSGSLIQGGESKTPSGSEINVSPVGDVADRAPERAGPTHGAAQALAHVLRTEKRDRDLAETRLRAEHAARALALEAIHAERVSRAVAAQLAGEAEPGGDPEVRELVRLGEARDELQARALIRDVDDRPLVRCDAVFARAGLCCPVHRVRASLRGDS